MLVAAALLAGAAAVAAAALVGVRGGLSNAGSPARASAAGGFARLPVPLRGLVSGTLGRSERVFWIRHSGAGFVLVNGAQGFSARFSDSGVRVSARGGRLALSLAGVGYGSSLRPPGSRAPSADRNRVSYADGPLTQWFENGPLGLEQGFTLRAPPAGAARGPVTIALRVGGSLKARAGWWRRGGRFHRPGRGGRASLRGSAGGRRARACAARVARRDRRRAAGSCRRAWRALSAADRPVRPAGPEARRHRRGAATPAQGCSVALSADGNTALVGGPDDNSGEGAAWVFTRSGTTWTQQGPKLVGTGAAGDADQGAQRGAVGRREHGARRRPRDNGGMGAAWVFTRSGTTWTQQGPKLAGTGAVGARRPGLERGAVGRREHRADRRLRRQRRRGGGVGVHALGDDLDPAGPKARRHRRRRRTPIQGVSVALSGDGNTALVGGIRRQRRRGGGVGVHALGDDLDPAGPKARRHRRGRPRRPGLERGAVGRREHRAGRRPGDNGDVGAAWVFTRSGSTWTQQGPKLVGSGAIGTAARAQRGAVGRREHRAGRRLRRQRRGAAWVFTRSGSTWTQQGPKLVGSGAVGDASGGSSVALSGDGNTALVGDPVDNPHTPHGTPGAGAVWVFVR